MTDHASVGHAIHRAGANPIDDDGEGAGSPFRWRRLHRQFGRRFVDVPAVLPAVVGVGDYPSLGIDAGTHLCHLRWTVIVPAEFIPAPELHAHGPSYSLRH